MKKAIIIMPKDAPHIKVEATKRHGANRYAED
jgi:threonine dehydratase